MCQLNCATRRSNPHQTRAISDKNALPRKQNLKKKKKKKKKKKPKFPALKKFSRQKQDKRRKKAYLYDEAEEIRPVYEQEPDEEDDVEGEGEGEAR
ncbi:hypothetical protein EUGRSUZ_A00688 [Eucalyptus grandis]|uniref:Uncharacterized protein n=2 Tax=Eucalyptus grandis TaxID=71139 RepID=A0ACC3M0P5_EUCGR|nr:hypothetical protein EUGRSUZ_A00688 [Eucalyptus grandis]